MDLTDWAGKVNGTMSNMDALSQSLNDLQIKFRMHLSDLSMVEENKKKIAIYEQQCREKDDQIQNQLATISTLTKISLDQEKKMADERNAIEEQRKELGREHLEKSRGIDAVIAREKKNLLRKYSARYPSPTLRMWSRKRQKRLHRPWKLLNHHTVVLPRSLVRLGFGPWLNVLRIRTAESCPLSSLPNIHQMPWSHRVLKLARKRSRIILLLCFMPWHPVLQEVTSL